MKVIDLPTEKEKLYCQCLEEWSDEIREAGDHKEQWLQKMKGQGLRVKVAIDDQGTIGGMIHTNRESRCRREESVLYVLHLGTRIR